VCNADGCDSAFLTKGELTKHKRTHVNDESSSDDASSNDDDDDSDRDSSDGEN
jgi:hypothetical protein